MALNPNENKDLLSMTNSVNAEFVMLSVIDQILQLPKEQQLEEALAILRELTCESTSIQRKISKIYGTSPTEARLFLFLGSHNKRAKSKEQIYTALYGYRCDVQLKTIDVYISSMRKKGIKIETISSVGWKLISDLPEVNHDIFTHRGYKDENNPKGRHNAHWTPSEDEEMMRMVKNGSQWWAIADELGRTERGVLERYSKIKGKKQ